MKKVLTLVLAVVCVIALSACENNNNANATTPTREAIEQTPTQTETPQAETPEPAPESNIAEPFKQFVDAIEDAGYEVYFALEEKEKYLERNGMAIAGASITLRDKWGDMGDIVVIFQYEDEKAIQEFWETGSPKYYPNAWKKHGVFAIGTSHEYLFDICMSVEINE